MQISLKLGSWKWEMPVINPKGARSSGVPRQTKSRIINIKTKSPIVFVVEVAMINLLFHAWIYSRGMVICICCRAYCLSFNRSLNSGLSTGACESKREQIKASLRFESSGKALQRSGRIGVVPGWIPSTAAKGISPSVWWEIQAQPIYIWELSEKKIKRKLF